MGTSAWVGYLLCVCIRVHLWFLALYCSVRRSVGDLEVHAAGVGDAAGGVEDLDAEEVAVGVVVEEDAGLVLVATVLQAPWGSGLASTGKTRGRDAPPTSAGVSGACWRWVALTGRCLPARRRRGEVRAAIRVANRRPESSSLLPARVISLRRYHLPRGLWKGSGGSLSPQERFHQREQREEIEDEDEDEDEDDWERRGVGLRSSRGVGRPRRLAGRRRRRRRDACGRRDASRRRGPPGRRPSSWRRAARGPRPRASSSG